MLLMEKVTHVIGADVHGQRVDRALALAFPEHSRTYLQELVRGAAVLINGTPITRTSSIVHTGDQLDIIFPATKTEEPLPLPEKDLGVTLLYEHEDFLIVYKPAGLLVHMTSKKNSEFSLVDWLLHRFKEIKKVGSAERPGIVHRLDKDTSGILIIPRTPQAHATFSKKFEERRMHKYYFAVVAGKPPQQGTIDFNIGRHSTHKHKMAASVARGRDSLTHYKVLAYFEAGALIEVHPVTGRTHQIRVHCAATGFGIIGDTTYGTASPFIARQALHAYQLCFEYKNRWYSFCYGLPEDMQALIIALQNSNVEK